MKKLFTFLITTIFILSCENFPEPGFEVLESYSYTVLGNNQTGESDQYLTKEIGVFINLPSLISISNRNFILELEVTTGGGTIDKQQIEISENGRMTTKWKLGKESNKQIILARIIDSEDKIYSEFEITANTYLMENWNTITQGHLTRIIDLITDTANERSMMLCSSGLYSLGEKFYKWNKIYSKNNLSFQSLEINSEGTVFAGTTSGELYKSYDWGINWEFIKKPIPDNNFHYELTVTSDDYIWANKWEHGIYCSNDNGVTWQKDSVGLESGEQMSRIYKFGNNSHLALSLNQLRILQTFDEGKTWATVNTPDYSTNMYVTSENEIIAYNQEGGFSLHKSTDSGINYNKVLTGSVLFGLSPMKHTFKKYRNYYYILAPGGAIFKTGNFESFEKLISITEQKYLFIDHTGNIYASGSYNEPVLVLPNH